jgi:hypothetical protein
MIKNIFKFSLILILTSYLTSIEYLPWWFFVIPLYMVGIIAAIYHEKNICLFGFISGFLTWALGNIFFHFWYHENVLAKISISFTCPKFMLYVIAGIIGGSLNGLAIYSGMCLGQYLKSLYLSKNDEKRSSLDKHHG